jgi:hypothetical protein
MGILVSFTRSYTSRIQSSLIAALVSQIISLRISYDDHVMHACLLKAQRYKRDNIITPDSGVQ